MRVSAPAPTRTANMVTIDYIYDSLYRLTEANYSNDDFYHYTYYAVGNRLTQESMINGLSSMVNLNLSFLFFIIHIRDMPGLFLAQFQ